MNLTIPVMHSTFVWSLDLKRIKPFQCSAPYFQSHVTPAAKNVKETDV